MTLAGRHTATAAGTHVLARYRSEFPIFRDGIYLNTCSLGALGERSRRRVVEFLDVWQRRGASAWYDVWWAALGELRARYGRVVNAAPAEIALAPSISVALSAVAEALDYTRRRRAPPRRADARRRLPSRRTDPRGREGLGRGLPDRRRAQVAAGWAGDRVSVCARGADAEPGAADRRLVRPQEPVRVRPARPRAARGRAPLRARHPVAGGGVRPARRPRVHRGDRRPGDPAGDRRALRRPDRAGARARLPAQGRAARRGPLGDRHAAGGRSGRGRP